MVDDAIALTLSKDEALVLFEWCTSIDLSGCGPENESAEQRVLWKIESQLEKLLVEPFAPNYRELVENAKRRILAAT
jgi:hypothetical protein